MNPQLEEWRDVVGAEGVYRISSCGRVMSVARRVAWRGTTRVQSDRIMSQHQNGVSGHMSVHLRFDGKSITRTVHSLVLEAFVGPRPDGMEGCHWDDDPSNNRVENLRWGTRSDNMNDRVRNGIHNHASRDECVNGHALAGDNVRPADLSDGIRHCRSCSIERSAAWREHREFDVLIADAIFGEIMRGERPLGKRQKSIHRIESAEAA